VAGLTSVTSTTFVGALTGAATTAGTATTATTATNQSGGTINATTGSFSGLLTGASSASIDVNTANDVGSFSVRGNSTTIASVTFHRTGAYAINMGLGVDNVFRIGGWSASANCLQLSGTGAGTFLSSVAATAFNSSGVITATGNITGGNLSVSTGIVTLGSIVNANANAVGNIGSSTKYFNTVFAKATSAQYADLAELYTTDNINYPPGTCVAFGGTDEITQTTTYAQTDVAGVVSTNPAYIMNAGTDGLPVALQGRVPCRVIGTIAKGDLVTSSNIAGVATRLAPDDWRPGAVIGKSLQHFDSETEGVIEVVVGRV
jgi:hypothetical protein